MFIGAAGTFIMIAPDPIYENKDSPIILTAVTLTLTLYPCIKKNGAF
jgi:hypothetical protein